MARLSNDCGQEKLPEVLNLSGMFNLAIQDRLVNLFFAATY
jgi:hypothetical protein